MIWPKSLQKGDTVAMLATSGPCKPERIPLAVQALESLGLNCRVMDSCYAQKDYLAGADELRAADLHTAFADPSIKGIFAARGGYGAQRILPLLDYDLIRRNPKIFAGYSDVTALHTVFNQICGFICFHAPMPASDLYDALDTLSFISLHTALFAKPQIMENPSTQPLISITSGKAKGRLTGGNLSLLASSLGTAYEVDTVNKIIFIEEINEEPYKIDRLLLQLKLAGKFTDCAGIVLGRFTPFGLADIERAVNDLLLPEGKPILGNFACGHELPSITLPLGAEVFMDAGEKKIGLSELE